MLEFLGVIVTVIAVAGVILNNRHNKLCFIVWFFSNALSLVIHATLMCWSLTLRDAIFIYLAYDGYIKWSKLQNFFKETSKCQKPTNS
jgi:nicotinamide riboside transporter PnuC